MATGNLNGPKSFSNNCNRMTFRGISESFMTAIILYLMAGYIGSTRHGNHASRNGSQTGMGAKHPWDLEWTDDEKGKRNTTAVDADSDLQAVQTFDLEITIWMRNLAFCPILPML